jgi:hypothetical protein
MEYEASDKMDHGWRAVQERKGKELKIDETWSGGAKRTQNLQLDG